MRGYVDTWNQTGFVFVTKTEYAAQRWTDIAKLLPPGRTGEFVKNRYKRPRPSLEPAICTRDDPVSGRSCGSSITCGGAGSGI